MFRQTFNCLSLITIISLFIQCKNTVNSSATNETKPESSIVEIPSEKTELVEQKTGVAENEPDTIKILAKTEKITDSIQKVAAKTTAIADREAEPKKQRQETKKRAKVKFEKTTFQFGTIKEGEKVQHDFVFKNVGDAPLLIKKVDVSCGCTFPSYPFIPIEPGEEGTIGVTFNSEHKSGRQKPTVTIITNARPRTHKLYMEGFVE